MTTVTVTLVWSTGEMLLATTDTRYVAWSRRYEAGARWFNKSEEGWREAWAWFQFEGGGAPVEKYDPPLAYDLRLYRTGPPPPPPPPPLSTSGSASSHLDPGLVDDVSGGTKTTALMWAETQIVNASALLLASGARREMTLDELSSIDADSFGRLMEGHVLLGSAPPTSKLHPLISSPGTWARIQRAADAHARNLTFPQSAIADGSGEDASDLQRVMEVIMRLTLWRQEKSQVATAMRDLTKIVFEQILNPLFEARVVTGRQILNRIYMPMRLSQGAAWDSVDGVLVGGPTASEIHDALIASNLRTPGYLPFLLRRPTPEQDGFLLPDDWSQHGALLLPHLEIRVNQVTNLLHRR